MYSTNTLQTCTVYSTYTLHTCTVYSTHTLHYCTVYSTHTLRYCTVYSTHTLHTCTVYCVQYTVYSVQCLKGQANSFNIKQHQTFLLQSWRESRPGCPCLTPGVPLLIPGQDPPWGQTRIGPLYVTWFHDKILWLEGNEETNCILLNFGLPDLHSEESHLKVISIFYNNSR